MTGMSEDGGFAIFALFPLPVVHAKSTAQTSH
jgi:hypothetical protein